MGDYEDLFAPGCEEVFYAFSAGCPRLINLLADRALLAGFSRQERPVPPRAARAQGQGDGRAAGARPVHSEALASRRRRRAASRRRAKFRGRDPLRDVSALAGARGAVRKRPVARPAQGYNLGHAARPRRLLPRAAARATRASTGASSSPCAPPASTAARSARRRRRTARTAVRPVRGGGRGGRLPALPALPARGGARHAGLARQLRDGLARAAPDRRRRARRGERRRARRAARRRRPPPAPALRAAPRRVAARGRRDASRLTSPSS